MLRAVIIDDEYAGVGTLELMLKKHVPYVEVIATSNDEEEGIRLIELHRPDIVFLDISMPVMNGFQLLEQLRFRDFHLVFITAHRDYVVKAGKINAFDYLLKPIDADDLKMTADKILKARNGKGEN
ncbi:MAG: response regulator transcription factor [Bacteroidetes bacterium]|jgi:two-component system LytT family response regulator|nr:response regulator transcription factor [Bacteroidota bacterium]